MDGRSREDGITVGEHNISVMWKGTYENKELKDDRSRKLAREDNDPAACTSTAPGWRFRYRMADGERNVCSGDRKTAVNGCDCAAAEHNRDSGGKDPIQPGSSDP